jgi:adenylate cyclase
MHITRNRKSQNLALITISLLSVTLSFFLSQFGLMKEVQLKSVNALFRMRGPVAPRDTSIVIVAIDEEALASLPSRWPYPAFYYIKLLQNLKVAGARAIVFDIDFTEPNLDHPEYDMELARAVAEAPNVVLAGKSVVDVGSYGAESMHVLKPVAPLLETNAPWGLANVIEDSDGFLRRYLLFQRIARKWYYPLAVETLRLIEKAPVPADVNPLEKKLTIGRYEIVKSAVNTMYINYRGPAYKTFKTYSMAQVIDDSTLTLPGQVDVNSFFIHKQKGTFKDKIVFIGATAEELQDSKFTPFHQYKGQKRKMPGVELHAQALSTILDNDYLVNVNPHIALFCVIMVALITSYSTINRRPLRAAASVTMIAILTVIMSYFSFAVLKCIPPVMAPMLSIFLTFTATRAYQRVEEQRGRNRIRRTFKNSTAPHIVDKLLNSAEMPSLDGVRRELTILFSDIRRFTAFSDARQPELVISRLSEYLTEMTDVVIKNDGTLDKFIGDKIMALFGAPYYYDDHALSACKTALEMVEKSHKIQKKWTADAKDNFQIGIGINTGTVIVGNLGSSQLSDYTAIGEQVSLGARLQSANKKYETNIILSERTLQQVKKNVIVRELDIIRVMGRTLPIRIYELRGMERLQQIEQDYIIDIFTEGLRLYRQRRWAEAMKTFHRVLRYFPSDGPSRLYTIRCLDHIEKSPALDWDGVFELEEK